MLSGLESESSCDEQILQRISSSNSNAYQLNSAGIFLRTAIESTSQLTMPWPPTANDLTTDKGTKYVPPELFNFLAIITGHTDIVTDWTKYCDPQNSTKRKLISIAQDLVYLSDKGAKTTPKSLALGLTLRHMTGSKAIAKLISGLGHSCSYDSIMRFETALALKQSANISSSIPPGFLEHAFTMLIYDNIDFSEETLTGHGTTHHTNSIMIQLKSQVGPQNPIQTGVIPKTQRTLCLPSTEIAPFYISSKSGPATFSPTQTLTDTSYQKSISTDVLYIARKTVMQPETPLPGWTAYNIRNTKPLPVSNIHYMPVIEASPTQLSTVNHILLSALSVVEQLKCESCMVVFDQAIYSKAQQIRWCNPEMQQKLVLRLGEFHTVMCFLSTIGKRFAMSGLEDILVESEVVAQGSIKGILNGHMYNRSVRSHKLLFEALSRMQFMSFLESLGDEESERIVSKITECQQQHDKLPEEIEKNFLSFIEKGASASQTFAFWRTYQEMVHTLLSFIRATRTSNWELHLSSLEDMLPWMFAYDRTNYAR